MWTLTKETSMVTNFVILYKNVWFLSYNQLNDRFVVVMDNASIHHVDRVVATIQQTGAPVRFLPPYSPDLNPIEEVFTEVKSYLAYDVTSSPNVLITMRFCTVSSDDCIGYIHYAGYNTQ